MNPLKRIQKGQAEGQYIYDAYNFAGYNKPWTRCIPYLMGLAAAMWFHLVGAKIRLSHRFVVCGYALSFLLFIFVVVVAPANYFGGIKRFARPRTNRTFAPREHSTPKDIIHDGLTTETQTGRLKCAFITLSFHFVVAATCVTLL